MEQLTTQQQEVVDLAAAGLSVEEIARYMAENTSFPRVRGAAMARVESMLRAARERLGVQEGGDLTPFASRRVNPAGVRSLIASLRETDERLRSEHRKPGVDW